MQICFSDTQSEKTLVSSGIQQQFLCYQQILVVSPLAGGVCVKAILVDDEPIMLRSFMRNSAGISDLDVIAQFQNADEALSYMAENAVDIAFLDIVLPKINGIELAHKLRKLQPDLLIVFVSAHEDVMQTGRNAPCDDCLLKPYNKTTIAAMMDKLKALHNNQP